jgi:hypothetical protein
MLDVDHATSFLLDRGLIDVQMILDGELIISSAARRNRNLRVEHAGRGFLLKHPGDPTEGGHVTLGKEAAFYVHCQTAPAASPMLEILPRLVYHDPHKSLLAVELYTDAVPLWTHMAAHAPPSIPRPAFRALGEALGTFHLTFRLVDGAPDPSLNWLTGPIPWVMLAHKPGPELLQTLSQANYQTLQILQSQGGLAARLDTLRKNWRPRTVIHNDVKSDNVLVRPGQEPGSVEVRIVDWELVQIGDPAWDLAGALQDVICFWVYSMPLSRERTAEQMMAEARYPLEAVQAVCRALWAGYRSAAGPVAREDPSLLTRAVIFSSARMIQSAYEMAFGAAALPPPAVVLLQVGANVLDDPELAQVRLFGLHGGAIL